jgi:hypothetical protein
MPGNITHRSYDDPPAASPCIPALPRSSGTWVEHFPGGVRWTNVMQIVKSIAPSAAISLQRSISCRGCQDDFGLEREQIIHTVWARRLANSIIRRGLKSLTVIGHRASDSNNPFASRRGVVRAAQPAMAHSCDRCRARSRQWASMVWRTSAHLTAA